MQKPDSTAHGADKTPARVRGRPRAFDRAAALEQATRLFWTKGYGATSIADLTEAMGIGSPSLYAAFGSKEALYAEALEHYRSSNSHLVEAVAALLMDSAAVLTGSVVDIPRGCMLTLSAVGSEGHAELGELVRVGRQVTYERLKARIDQAVTEGEIAASVDGAALARFIQTVQYGMSTLARDGAERAELEAVAQVALAGWDARTSR